MRASSAWFANAEQWRRGAALGAFVLAVVIPRFADLGRILTIDEPLWQARGAQFIEGLATLDFPKTFTHVHPGVTTAWLVGLVQHSGSFAVSQAAIALAVTLGILASTYVLIRLTSFWVGSAAGAVLALDPFFIAHSRVIHTDALLGTFLLLTVLLLLLYRQTGERRYLVASGMVGGLVALTKFSGLVILPLFPLLVWYRGIRLRSLARQGAAWVACMLLTVVLLWPALWLPTKKNIGFFVERMSVLLQEEKGRGGEEHWWYYGREILFRTTPVSLVLGVFGTAAAVTAFRWWSPHGETGRQLGMVVLALVSAGVVRTVVLSFAGTKSDRWILQLFFALDIAALYGVLVLARATTAMTRLPFRVTASAGVLAVLVSLAADVWREHPYTLAHYNRLFGIEDRRKLGWGEGLEQVADWLETRPNAGVPVVSYYPRVLSEFYDGQVERLVHANEPRYKYVVLYRSMFERLPDSYESPFIAKYLDRETPLFVANVNGLPFAWVFENKGGP